MKSLILVIKTAGGFIGWFAEFLCSDAEIHLTFRFENPFFLPHCGGSELICKIQLFLTYDRMSYWLHLGWSSLAFSTKILLFWVFCPTWAVSRHYIISRGCWQTWKRAAWLYFPEKTQFLSCSATDEKAIKACVVCKPTANAVFHLGSVVNPDSGRSQGEPNTYWVSCRALSHGELCQLTGARPTHPSHPTTLILIN